MFLFFLVLKFRIIFWLVIIEKRVLNVLFIFVLLILLIISYLLVSVLLFLFLKSFKNIFLLKNRVLLMLGLYLLIVLYVD